MNTSLKKNQKMNREKYRKWYLTENWLNNQFIVIKEKVNPNVQWNHPKVLSGEAFWNTYNELCIGYYSAKNHDIFRPIFSDKRQRLLDKVHHGNIEGDEGDKYSINNPHLGYARKKYLDAFNNKMPMDCIEIILSFIHPHMHIYPI